MANFARLLGPKVRIPPPDAMFFSSDRAKHDGLPVDRSEGWTIPCRIMAIRFQCGACSQPIEVDDEWASKTVACPYCRKTVTAPAESILDDLSRIPTAFPLTPPEAAVPPPLAPPYPAPPLAGHPNGIALVALGLAFCVLASLLIAGAVAARHRLEFESLQEQVLELQEEGMGFIAATQQASADFYESHGGMPPGWMMALVFLELGGGLAWIATIVCGVIAVRRPRRRGFAVASLVIAGLVPIVFCCGMPFSVAAW